MKRFILWMLLPACSSDLHTFDNGLFELAAGFNAKEACSCVFVSRRTEARCDDWVRVSPNIANFKVDHEAGTLTSKALGGSRTIARFVSDEEGCVVDPR